MKQITLKDWMREEGLSRYRVAKMLGTCTRHISLVLTGERRSIKLAQQIHELTKGRVSRESVIWADETD